MATRAERNELVTLLGKHTDTDLLARIAAVKVITRNATTYKRLAEAECNGPDHGDWSEAWAADITRKAERCEERIRKAAASIGCGVVFSGDPRGATVKLTVPDGYTDDWGGVGICVPGA